MKLDVFNPFLSSVAAIAALLAAPLANADPIAWNTPTQIAGNTDVLTAGSLNYAYNFNNSTQTVNGVTFTGTNSTTTIGTDVTLGGGSWDGNAGSSTFGAVSGTFNGLTPAYKAMLAGASYATGVKAITLQNLTSGRVYATQVWVNDSRTTGNARNETFTSTGGNAATLDYNNTNALGGVGQYSTGRFVAGAATQQFTISGNGGSGATQINAFQVREVTNIGNWIGTGGATWDAATTNNFASNLFSDALVTTTFTAAKAPLNSVVFADSYWNAGVSTAVTQTAVTVDAAGVSASAVFFDNSAVDYTISNASGVTGITGGTALMKSGSGKVTLSSANTYTGITSITGGTLEYSSSDNQTLSGAFTGTGTLTKSGAGTLTLTNSGNTHSGTTTISGGTLQIGGGGRLGNGSYGNTISIASGATLQYSSSAAQTLSGAITGLGGITKDTTSELTLSSTSNTYSGTTTISAGRLGVTVATNLSSGATSVVQSGTGQLFINNTTGTFNNPFHISTTGFAESGDSQNNVSGAIRMGSGSPGSMSLSNTITLAGNSRISGFLGATGTLVNTISGQITGGFGIDFYGFQTFANTAEVFVLSNTANNYTGTTTILNSNYNTTNLTGVSTTLRLGASSVIPDGANAGNVAFAINGTNNNAVVALDLNGFSETINGLTVNAGTFTKRITNSVTGASVLSIGANDTTSSFSGTITDAGTGKTLGITKIGAGNLTLTNSNNYIGGTIINGGTLTLGHATDTLSNTGAVNVNGGTLALDTNTDTVGAVTLTSGSVTGTGAGKLTGTGSAFDVRSGTISAKLGGTVGLTKTTAGTVTINSDNSVGGYTGVTDVNDGKLVVNGNISTSSLTTVAIGATLGGTGTVAATTINGSLAPGNSIGTLNATGDVTWNNNDAWVFELGSAASTLGDANTTPGLSDLLNITGAGNDFLKGSGSSFTFDFATGGALGWYKLVDWTSTTNFVDTDFIAMNLGSGLTGEFTVDSGTSALYLNVVPEPNVAALLGGLGVLTLLRRRRN